MTSLLPSQIADWIPHAAQRIWNSLRPRSCGSEIVGTAVDVSRSRRELVIENATLRHQVNILRRGKRRPRLGVADRLKLLLRASLLHRWRQWTAQQLRTATMDGGVGSGRRELLDHVILLGDRHLDSLVREYKVYFNEARPHKGIGRRRAVWHSGSDLSKPIVIRPVLGGPHADYRRAA